MRVNVQKFQLFYVYNYTPDAEPIVVDIRPLAPVSVAEMVQQAKKYLGIACPVVEPCIEWRHHEVYLRTLQQQARAAFHLQEQEKLEG